MSGHHILDRRRFLRAGAVTLGLPALEAFLPRGFRSAAAAEALAPRRLVLVARDLGLHTPFLFPTTTGPGYESTRYLRLLDAHRGTFTLFSGVSHPGHNDHKSEPGLFTGVAWERIRDPQREHRNTISLDQLAAEHLGGPTRHRNLVIGRKAEWAFSWTAKGTPVPTEGRPTEVFKRLFVAGPPADVAREVHRLRAGQSILDGVRDQARALGRTLGPADKARLEQTLAAVRDAETVLHRAEAWAGAPKPRVEYPPPARDPDLADLAANESLWYDLVRLALQTDSTRVVLLTLPNVGRPKLGGLSLAHHDASHHGQDNAKIEQLALVEEAELRQFARFLGELRAVREADGTLLDRTAVLSASNLGNASAHTSRNLPVVLAGGGFAHRGHVGYDRANNLPLSNLYVRVLRQLGIPADRFGTSTGAVDAV